jgi:NADH-quinone oxidoreductase subunit N
MYFDKPVVSDFVGIANAPFEVRAVLTVNGALVLILGLVPGGLLALCANAVRQMLGT